MLNETELSQLLIDALAEGRTDVDPTPFAALDVPAAIRVQALVQNGRHEVVRFAKVATPIGMVIGSPIFTSMTTSSSKATISAKLVQGIEVEVAAVLGKDLEPSVATQGEAAVRDAISHFVVGIELIGSRFPDRTKVGLVAQLADNLSAGGYVTDPNRVWSAGTDLSGALVEVSHNGNVIHSAPAKHNFGSVLGPLMAYAANPFPSMPLKKGMIVTTGTLCGLIGVPGQGHMVARLNDHRVELDVT